MSDELNDEMSDTFELNAEMLSRYQSGYAVFKHLFEKVTKRDIKRFSILTYYDQPFHDSEDALMTSEQATIALTNWILDNQSHIIIFLDTLHNHEYNLSTLEGFQHFMSILSGELEDYTIFRLGINNNVKPWLNEFPHAKLSMDWLSKHSDELAKILTDASPVMRDVSQEEAQISNFEDLYELLVEQLGPPSITDELMGKIKEAESSDVAGEALTLLTVFVSPGTAVSKGVKYLSRFMSLVKDRRKKEVQQVFQEWDDRVREGYAPEKLKEFISDDEHEQLIEAIRNHRITIIFNDTKKTIYEIFAPLLIENILYDLGAQKQESEKNEEITDEANSETNENIEKSNEASQNNAIIPRVTLIYDSFINLLKYKLSTNVFDTLINQFDNFSIVPILASSEVEDKKYVTDKLADLLEDGALVFDMSYSLFDTLFKVSSMSERAWIEFLFRTIYELRNKNRIAALDYYPMRKESWSLLQVRIVHASPIKKIRKLFGIR